MPAAEYSYSALDRHRAHFHLFRIVNPCDSVLITRQRESSGDARAWLMVVQMVKKDPFLELQRFDGLRWIGQLDDNFDCCA